VQVRGDIQILSLVHLQIFEVADKDSVHTNTNDLGDDVEDSEGDDDGEAQGDGGQRLIMSIQNGNSNDGAEGSEEDLANEEDEASDGVHDDSAEEVARNEVKALSCCRAETVSMHGNMDVGELVDVLNDALNAAKDALETADEAYQNTVLGVGFLAHLQKEI